jgi:hypothetical protein
MMGEGKNMEFMKQYGQKEKEQKMKKEVKKNLGTYEGDEDHTTTTAEEYISELSPATLGSYIKKASVDSAVKVGHAYAKAQGRRDIAGPDANDPKTRKLVDKAHKRFDGIATATDKLTKQIPQKDKKGNTIRGASPDSTQYFSQEEYVAEDDMKGMSVKSGHKRPTKAGAGMTKKGVEAYRRRNPGSKLKTAVTGKVKKGSKDAKRRKSYCARSAGQMKKFPKAAKDPNSRLRQARRRWKC